MKVSNKRLAILAIKMSLLIKSYDGAIAQLDLALEKWPTDIELLGVAQDVYSESQHWDDFYRLNRQVSEIYPNNILLRRYVATMFMTGYHFEDALSQLVYCVENWNLDASYSHMLGNTYARLAICCAHLGKWEDVDTALQKAETLASWDPDIACAHFLKLLGTNNSRNLGEFLDGQLEKHPRLHALYFWKGLYTQYYLHDSKGCIDWYELSLQKINSMQADRNYWRDYLSTMEYAIPWHIVKRGVDACVEVGDSMRAVRLIYQSRFTIWDSDIDTRIFRIYLDILNERSVFAENKCELILRRSLSAMKRTEYWLLLAQAQSNQGKLDEGLSSIKQALALNPEKIGAWDILGSIQMMRKDWQQAIQVYQKIISMNRFDFRCWRNLGLCYINIGDVSLAKQSYEQVVQLNAFEADTWADLANIYMISNEKDLALAAYQNGLKFDWLSPDKRQLALQAVQQLNVTQ